MKKYIFILICISFFSMFSQSALKTDGNFTYKDFPQEKIFVHFNSSFLVSGENLFYKIYCINAHTNKLSSLSKIAYVELINSDKNTVFKHKIILESGLGKGEFFIKTSIPSGNYKLIAYTQWMRNEGVSTFFQNDITIINPFRANQKLTVKTIKHQDTVISKNDALAENTSVLNHPIKNEFLELHTNKKTFLKREKVILTLKSLKDAISHGNYSVSVKKMDAVNGPSKHSSNSFVNENYIKTTLKDSILYLPELRGEIVSGTVFTKETNTPKSNVKVSLSVSGEHAIFKIATTNKSGKFYFNIDNEYENPNVIIQVIDSKRDDYRVELNTYKLPNYNSLVFNDFILTPKLNDLILQKSILNQIENAYYSVKNDSILPVNFQFPSYKYKEKKYVLNDYTRFKTLKETVTEVVDAAYVVQKNDGYTFHIKFYNDVTKPDVLPLVLIDGVFIQNHNTIIDYNARTIKSIGVVRDKYIYGGQSFMGVINIETFKGNYTHPFKGDYMKSFELVKPLVNKTYFKQDYNDDTKLNRIPDFRSQLLWHPNLTLNTDKNQVSFYTSDNTGEYDIYIEGFTNNGKPVTLKEFITVKNE